MTVDIEKLEALARAWRIHVAQQEISDKILNLISDFKSMSYDHDLLMVQRDQLMTSNAVLKTGYEAYERVNAELRAECKSLREIISKSATACGAAVSVDCSLEFMAMLPSEIELVMRRASKEKPHD